MFLLGLMILPSLAVAQGPTPGVTIFGQVKNEDGSPAPDAAVEIMDLQSNQTYTATANQTGWYVIYNIAANTGDRFDVTATLGDMYGHRTTGITATSPLYEVNITLTEKANSDIPITWLAAIAAVIAAVVIAVFFLKGGKGGDAKPNRRRK